MKNQASRSLDFAGKAILTVYADKQWWIAIKPVCEALEVDFEAQRKNIKEDPILSQLPSNQTVVGADNRTREMLCLPERYVYGWLFSIRSDSSKLLKYKLSCYDILYAHFHGTITGRLEVLSQRRDIEERIAELKIQLLESPQQSQISDLLKQKSQTAKRLKELDAQLLSGQTALELK